MAIWQIVLITLYSIISIFDNLNTKLEFGKPLMAGAFAGLVMGNLTTGLAVGGTLQLMILGVGSFGGATIPDYTIAALIATPLAIISGKDLEFAIGLGVPIGLLMTQLDILARISNVFIMKQAEKAVESEKYDRINVLNHLGLLTWGLSRCLPVVLALSFGVEFVQFILAVSPEWLIKGLKLAGGLLPAVGISMLLKYLPLKTYFPFLVIGFVCMAYLKIPMLGVAFLGGAIAIIYYQYVGGCTVQYNASDNNCSMKGDEEDE